MPEADYTFKPGPAPEMRTFGQLFAHVANAQFGSCAAAKGVANPNQGKNLENELKTKAEFVKALADSFAFCDDAYSALTDQNAMEMVSKGRTPSPARPSWRTTCRTTTRCTAPAPSTCAPRAWSRLPPSAPTPHAARRPRAERPGCLPSQMAHLSGGGLRAKTVAGRLPTRVSVVDDFTQNRSAICLRFSCISAVYHS